MDIEESSRRIEANLNQILRDKGWDAVVLHGEMKLLGGDLSIDSLDLAVLLTMMQRDTGKDPFKGGFRNFQTVGELARLYAE